MSGSSEIEVKDQFGNVDLGWEVILKWGLKK